MQVLLPEEEKFDPGLPALPLDNQAAPAQQKPGFLPPGERRGGTVTWVSSHVDHRTRTLKVRTEVDNADGLLRSGMYGKAVISIRDKEPTLVVPKDAVQWEGCCNVVFTRQSDMLFTPKKVRIGYDTDRFYVVEEGLEENEEIVTTGSFLLKTEIMKGSIGAGCCEAGLGRQES